MNTEKRRSKTTQLSALIGGPDSFFRSLLEMSRDEKSGERSRDD
jgi:hypothetical protein